MKKLAGYCLSHPCWSGVSGIVAIVSLAIAMKWPWALTAGSQQTPPAEQSSTGSPVHQPGLPDLSGKWDVSTEVSTSTFRAYEGLRMYYEVGIAQTGNSLQFAGEKDAEQKPRSQRVIYEGKARTTINGEGSIGMGEDRKAVIRISSKEGGTRRNDIETTFVLTEADDGSLRGSFKSQAASTTGTCVWKRVP